MAERVLTPVGESHSTGRQRAALSKVAPIIGSLGLVVDPAFHWAATADPSNVPAVMTTLLVDTDLAQDAWWLTLLGITVDLMFLVAILYLLVGSAFGRRGERTTPAAEGHAGVDFTAATRTVRIGRGRVARADALEEAR
jgi:hypothetical protein